TPYLQQPLALGADVVVHSTTKYVGGHSDVVGGALVVATGAQLPGGLASPAGGTDVAGAGGFHQNASGAVAGPFDAWLTLRGLKTLAVRMDRHQANAAAVAEFLASHPAVTEVIYPGLATHPGHELAARQMRGFGGMVSFRVGSEAKALDVCARTQVFTLAEPLGGVESLIEHPGRMTHGSVAGTALEVPDDLVRLSVGIADVEELDAYLGRALASRALPRTPLDVCARTQVFTLAESLGGVESLIEHPGRMTHGSVAGTALEVPDDLVRLSVGIEDVEDLVADLGRALA